MRLKFSPRLAIALAAVATPLAAQTHKRPLTQDDWDKWRAIQGTAISNDGKDQIAPKIVP